ncbi:transposase [Streptomyces sp. MMG1121]|uniref:transposase n=1 Tax=Streptomyces sp. MMG1121 TaxID=1415544 RepID=UPI00099CC279
MAPRSRTEDTARCQAAGTPGNVVFATEPALTVRMTTRALDVDVPASCVPGDELYGASPHLCTAWRNTTPATYSSAPATTRSPPTRSRSAPTPRSRNRRGEPARNPPPTPEPKVTVSTIAPWPTASPSALTSSTLTGARWDKAVSNVP